MTHHVGIHFYLHYMVEVGRDDADADVPMTCTSWSHAMSSHRNSSPVTHHLDEIEFDILDCLQLAIVKTSIIINCLPYMPFTETSLTIASPV